MANQAEATPSPSPRPGIVADAANLLSPDQEAAIAERLGRLDARTGHKVVIATIETLGGRAIDDVVEEMGNRLGVHDGVLLLIVHKDRELRLAVGRGSLGLMSQADARRIATEAIVPDLRRNRFDQGILKGVDRIVAELSESIA